MPLVRVRSLPSLMAERPSLEHVADLRWRSYVRRAMPDPRRHEDPTLRRLADEQAALRRVATLVAQGVGPAELFSVVSNEVGRLFGSDQAAIGRYEPDGSSVVYVGISEGLSTIPVGTRWPLEDYLATTKVYRTGRPARQEQRDYETATGEVADTLRELNTVSRVGAPIFVEGKLWGVLLVTDTHDFLPPDTEDRVAMFTELVATAIANAESRADLATSESRAHDLALEQAALRRVATLVARGTSADTLFSAVTEEVGRLFGADAVVARFDTDGSGTVVVGLTPNVPIVTIGTRWRLEDFLASTAVYRTGRPARNDHTGHRKMSGQVADSLRQMNYVSTVAAPIMVEGRLWGVMTVSDQRKSLPLDTEGRVAKFTELVATAIAEGESRSHLQQLASEQAALRRVATLVAQDVPADELFTAVAGEVGSLFGADFTAMIRYASDPNYVTTISTWAAAGHMPPAPTRPRITPGDPTSIVADTQRPYRVDDWSDVTGPIAEFVRGQLGVRSSVGCPIVVEGRLWGALVIHSKDDRFPVDTEARLLNFTGLVATAIANAESRAELAASRARVIAAADDARRRIERDLHDGAQQRLVTLSVALRTIEATMPDVSDSQRAEVARIADGLGAAIEELQELSRGIHPAVLTQGGLAPALKALRRRSPIHVTLVICFEHRLPDQIEAAAYYTVSEALTNASKHANATGVWVDVELMENTLHLSIRDDGVGGTDPSRGSGLTGLKDRIEALGGRIRIDSASGSGTLIEVDIPNTQTLQSRGDSDELSK
jgi:signal transduction histidine kinase